jgi:1,4-dihydroxy-6-naphthoate synthase
MKLTLGFSPCPNDTFIFDALIHHKIDTEGLEFEVSFDDVETLNQKVFRAELDISKISFHAYAYAIENYLLLNSGSALGFGVGPLLISKIPEINTKNIESENLKVAIPGKYTTANFLLGLALPKLTNKVLSTFSDIEGMLLREEVDLGLIIHENRFTYQEKGLHKIIDLGEFWEKKTNNPIPLGGIVINRKIDLETQRKVDMVLRKSLEYAFAHPQSGIDFIKSHAQEMDEAVMYKHIELYVNKYSINLGKEGRKAIQTLFDQALELKIIPAITHNLFLLGDVKDCRSFHTFHIR